MPIQIKQTGVVAGKDKIPFTDFPFLRAAHIFNVPRTLELEQVGRALLTQNFSDEIWNDLKFFIRKVCIWGGYSAKASNVLNDRKKNKVLGHFQKTKEYLAKNATENSVSELDEIFGLGVSFASKHLRFLRPDICPVFDSTLSEKLRYQSGKNSYKPTSKNYQRFSSECLNLAEKLTESNRPLLPGIKFTIWGAADVEMSLYAHFNFRNW